MRTYWIIFSLLSWLAIPAGAQVKLSPTSDGYIYLGGPNAKENFGSEATLRVRFAQEAQFSRQAYVRFDLSSQPASFTEATFEIYGQCKDAKLVDVFTAFGEWTDSSLKGSYNAKPLRRAYVGTIELKPTAAYSRIDVTEAVNRARMSKRNDITFVLIDRLAQKDAEEGFFHSKENPEKRPPILTLTEGKRKLKLTKRAYYVDADGGSDTADGLSPASAWKSLKRVEAEVFTQGDSVLFKRGCRFAGSLFPRVFSTYGDSSVTLFGAYGNGEAPVLDAEGKESFTLMFFNTPFLRVENLTITQTADDENPLIRRGLYYQGEDMGKMSGLTISGVTFRDIKGNTSSGAKDGDVFAKRSAALAVEITGNNIPTYLDGYLLEDCRFVRVGRIGAMNNSSWGYRTAEKDISWRPSQGVVIRRNYFEDTAGEALIVRTAVRPVVEFNVFQRCAMQLSGCAALTNNCDAALWQFNEVRYTVYNEGDTNGEAFGIDIKSRDALFRWNYAHHNEYGDMLVTGGSANGGIFNTNSVVSQNVFYNNGHHGIRISGNASHVRIEKNIIYRDERLSAPTAPYKNYPSHHLMLHAFWGGGPNDVSYINNIYWFASEEVDASFALAKDKSLRTKLEGNIFFADKLVNWQKATDIGATTDPQIALPNNLANWNGLDKMPLFRPRSAPQGVGPDFDRFGMTDSELTITLDKESRPLTVEIYTIDGRLVEKATVKPSGDSVYKTDVSRLADGCYAIKAYTDNSSFAGLARKGK
ncbi:MAG: DNRLRE domain-containing protein [Mediterranea sp.]|jgi:hypothetical protein|nr:DNRLRE domain-containing protein [Mediterranea sp.]